MSSDNTINSCSKPQNLVSNSMLHLYKRNLMSKFGEKTKRAKFTEKRKAKTKGNSGPAIARYRIDINMEKKV